jgi:sulfate transport system permease protein
MTAPPANTSARRPRSVLPGFKLTLGYTLIYLSLIVLIPIAAVFLRTMELSFSEFLDVISSP